MGDVHLGSGRRADADADADADAPAYRRSASGVPKFNLV
jgi:hypothetical protein